ncbi:tetratricopeptide repeat protein, partial [Microcoleus sp. herbarium19]
CEGEAAALCNLGNTQSELQRYAEAWECLQAALEIFREMGESASEAIVLYNLADLHYQIGNLDLAVSDCDRALSIAIGLDIPLQEDCRDLKKKLEFNHE